MKAYIRHLLLSVSLSMLPLPVLCEVYAGGSMGQADFERAGKQTSWEIIAGYQFNRHLAMESFYLNLGENSQSELNGQDSEITGIGMSILGIVPVIQAVDIYAKLGMYSWEAEIASTINVNNSGEIDNLDDEDLIIGAGAAWQVTKLVTLNLNYNSINFEGSDQTTDIYSLGAKLAF